MSNKLVKAGPANVGPDPTRKALQITVPIPVQGIQTVLVVVLKGDGELLVNGPLDKPELCKRMLKQCEAEIARYTEARRRQVEVVQHLPPGLPVVPSRKTRVS